MYERLRLTDSRKVSQTENYEARSEDNKTVQASVIAHVANDLQSQL